LTTTLVILAAGMGKRYGSDGQKQVEKIGISGEIIADFSVYDAIAAGFSKAVFVIKGEMQSYFEENITAKYAKSGIEVAFAHQSLDDLPPGYSRPENREKPWGTAHALWACRDIVKEPFMVINADDFYGASTYRDIHDFLINPKYGNYNFVMPGYLIANAVPNSGVVTRGICSVENGMLIDINETDGIRREGDEIFIQTEGGGRYVFPQNTLVSMNAFGFKPGIFREFEREFGVFLDENAEDLKAEFFQPTAVQTLIKKGVCTMNVIPAKDRWFGITNPEDKEKVKRAVAEMVGHGKYPERLF